MVQKLFLMLFVTVPLINVANSKDPISDCDACIEKPPCEFDDFDPNEFKIFKEKEECQFQIFMDKIQQLDCINMKEKVGCDENDAECNKRVFDSRNIVYDKKVDLDKDCKCKKEEGEEDAKVIEKFKEYTDCKLKSWKESIQNVTGEIDILEATEKYRKCTKLGEIHTTGPHNRCTIIN